jgi:hypothetical protein
VFGLVNVSCVSVWRCFSGLLRGTTCVQNVTHTERVEMEKHRDRERGRERDSERERESHSHSHMIQMASH